MSDDQPHQNRDPDGDPIPTESGAHQGNPHVGLFRVAVVYGLMGVGGWLGSWWLLDHHPWTLPEAPLDPPAMWLIVLLGAGIGAAVALLDFALEHVLPALRKMTEAFFELLGAMTPGRALAFAAFSAVGEEILFRGFLLPWLGLVASSLIFGALHFPPDRRLWLWPFLAGGIGFVFGWLFLYTGSLLAPILAHFTINYFGFMRLYAKTQPEQGLGSDHNNT